MTDPKPKYLINMALAAPVWDAEIYQIENFLNPHYLNSLWLGTVWNVLLLPTRLWYEVILTLAVDWDFVGAAVALVAIPISMVKLVCLGVIGRARAVRLPIEVMCQSRLMTEVEARDDIKSGTASLVRSLP